MKKLYLLLAALTLCFTQAWADATWTLQGKTYNVDTLYHANIGPGTTQTSLALSGGSRLNVFYITTDLTNPNVDIRVTKGSDKLVGCQTLSTMQKDNTSATAQYFAGVNADFFGNSQPIGSTVVNNEVYYGNNNTWVNWFMTEDKKPGIATIGFSGTATAGTATCSVSGVNVPRYENYLVVYTKRIGATSGTNAYGSEVSIEPLDGVIGFVGKQQFKVTCDPSSAGKMAIPANGYVLSGNGTGAAFVSTLKTGDIVTLDLNQDIPGFAGQKIAQMASGQPAILSKGEVLETQGALDHLVSLNPRTAVGFDATGTKLVLLVVDGRGASVGCVSKLLAEIMRETGCTEAMNFDGGGSSELYTSMFGVRNSPSDGKERAVTNAVWAVAVAPEDNEVAQISFEATNMELPKYGYYKPVIYGYNKYGVLLTTDLQGVTLSCDEALGEIINDGSTLFCTGSGYHALTAHYGSAKASIPVTIGSGEPKFAVSNILLDDTHTYHVNVTAATSKTDVPLDNSALSWSSADPAVATVDSEGNVKGVKIGTTTVTGVLDNFTGNLNVTVEIPEYRHLPLALAPEEGWTKNPTGVKNVELSPLGENGMAVSYTVSNARGTSLQLKKTIPFYAIPDSVRLVVNPKASKISKIMFSLENAAGEAVTQTYKPALKAGENNVVLIPVSDFFDAENLENYPVSFSYMRVYFSDPNNAALQIEIPVIEGVYVGRPENSGVGAVFADKDSDSVRICPNPAAAGSEVSVEGLGSAEGRVNVFAMDGRVVESCQLSQEQTFTAPAQTGLYIVSITCANKTYAAKLVVK